MVKIPALELDGQNWKIYRAKLLEHAATKGWLDVLAGAPDDRTNDWEGCNALLHELLHDTVPISIYIRLRRNTAHQVFKYLAKRFRDCEPIADPRTKKLATCANEDKRYLSAETSTSEKAATGADRENLPTKDLSRGTKDVDNRIVGREDPRTSAEASAMGTSAESANGTTALLTGAPHETQNEPQDSLPLTPRPPIEGEPNACKQAAADSIVTAERTNGTAQSANPRETVADVDRTATAACGVNEGTETHADVDEGTTLGRGPVLEACGIDEGDRERNGQLQPQRMNLYCKESRQHNENAIADVPSAYGLPLEGEWEVCASGRLSCEKGTSEGTGVDELGTHLECCQQLCMADGGAGREVEPTDDPNELEELVTVSIESEDPDGGDIPRVHLGGTKSRAGDANGCGNRADASSCQADASRVLTDVLRTLDSAGTAGISHGDGAGTYLDVGDTKRVVNATNGVGSRADASTGHGEVPCVGTDVNIPANATQTVRTPRKRLKPPDLPSRSAKRTTDEPNGLGNRADRWNVHTDVQSVDTDAVTTANATETVRTPRRKQKPPNSPEETARRRPDEPNGCGSHADASSVHTDTHCVENETETAENEAESIRSRRTGSRTRNSPNGRDIATPKLTVRWRKVSVDGSDVYVPRNAPIDTTNRRIVFGRVESRVEVIAPNVEGERAGDGDGDGNGGDGEGDTTSGGDVDSFRVKAALLAAKSQYTRYSPRSRRNDLPVSSSPPVQFANRPYGLVRRRRRRGRLKIERINISQTKEVEATHLGCAHATQPPGNSSNNAYGIVRPRRRRGRIKIAPINVNRTRIGRNAYLGRDNALRSIRRPKKRIRRVKKLTFEYRKQGEPWRNDGDYG